MVLLLNRPQVVQVAMTTIEAVKDRMQFMRERMDAINMPLNELNQKFCKLLQDSGDKNAMPVRRRRVLATMIYGDNDRANNAGHNPTVKNMAVAIAALGGKLIMRSASGDKELNYQSLDEDLAKTTLSEVIAVAGVSGSKVVVAWDDGNTHVID